ncbi:uncharacterized protein G2W53_001528 [Senna tora]|uniref:CCHC-type domain-containing protein n=1 Tax=Senna tora TaxID=362788 RepID=A0A834XHC8_9FABA|nr:uncharacterized protein G2W53_001528 [Senna tora]
MGDSAIVDRTSLGSEDDHPRPPNGAENHARNKKYRQDNGSFSGSQSRVPRDEEWMQENPKRGTVENTKMSYRDSVRNPARMLEFDLEENEGKEGDEDQGVDLEESVSSSDEEGNEPEEDGTGISIEKDVFDRFNLTLSDREWKRLNRPFRKSLIIKLLGKTVGFKFLLRKVNQLWGRTGEVELVDIGNNYFLAKFDTFTDREFTLTGGPWIILDHYLIIRPWTSLFDPEEQIQKMAAWVHLPDLPIELYDDKFLYTLGKLIGKVLKIDVNTSQKLRGKFARLCVELDLSKPLLSQYCVHGRLRKIEYEGLHLICFECGVYGHDLEHCPVRKARLEKEKQEKEKNQDTSEAKEFQPVDKYFPYGAWMSVVKPRRVRRSKPNVLNQLNEKDNAKNDQGSRFAILGYYRKQPENLVKIKTNINHGRHEGQQGSSEAEAVENMEIGSPVKALNQQLAEKPDIVEHPKEADPMTISPTKDSGESDFNEIANTTEQKGGCQPNLQRVGLTDVILSTSNLLSLSSPGKALKDLIKRNYLRGSIEFCAPPPGVPLLKMPR